MSGTHHLSRRGFLAAPSAAMLAGCAPRSPAGRPPLVSLHKVTDYRGDVLSDLIRRILVEHRVEIRGKRVLLKPNLVEYDPGAPINTNPVLVRAASEAFRGLGAAQVSIAEGPGHRRDTLAMAEAAGYFENIDGFESRFTDLHLDDVSRVRLTKPHSALREIYLPNSALGADLLVSMPKLKTHHWVVATLSMKNLFGLVPGGVYGWPKNVLHWAGINECIADLYHVFPKTFAIVDGIVGMEGNGPIQGTARPAGLLAAGRDLAAVDRCCCRLMGIDPERIHYLNLAGGRAPEVAGESERALRTAFALPPGFDSLRLRV